jgi:plastocyanin
MVKILLVILLLLPVAAGEETFTLSGTVKLEGPVPAAKPNKRLEGDPPCCALHPKTPPVDTLVVDPAGGVRWSFVYVKKGLEGKTFEPRREPATIDQKGCIYTPHVVGALTGQLVNFHNTDPMLHNVHPTPFTNKEYNFGQVQGAVSGVKFTQAEVPIRVVCNVHPWMVAYVCVVDHPYFAVTDAAGKFEIKGLPAGTYTVGVWHEGLEGPDQELTLKADAKAEFVMKKK